MSSDIKIKLADVLSGVEYESGDLTQETEICGITDNSRIAEKGKLFVCLKGKSSDGHDYAGEVMAKGAAAVVCERDLGIQNQIIVKSTREAYPVICANFFGNPAEKLRLIGVTGTNGKTTVTTLIKNIFTSMNTKSGLIGTIQNEIGDNIIPSAYTTPGPYELNKMFGEMVDAGCKYAVMEVSSFALAQNRVGGVVYGTAVFTNLTEEHMEYHEDMEDYYNSKKKLFQISKNNIINIDDEYGKRLLKEINGKNKHITYSIKDERADFFAKDIIYTQDRVKFNLVYKNISSKVDFPMPGSYSVYNALAVIAACTVSGVPLSGIINGLNNSKGVSGRSEIIPTGRDFTVMRDYAHSPDGLRNILGNIKQFAKGRVVILFGCGGDRDRTKRKIMGEIAAKYADYVIVTSDNPRTENPAAIIDEIMPGIKMHNKPYSRIENRKEAIFFAVQNALKDDIIILAGKGHEDYQIIGTEKRHFDEREIIAEALGTVK